MEALAPRLVFSGSRFGLDARWRQHVWTCADAWVEVFGPPRIVFEGEASGVDTHAKAWAKFRGFVVEPFYADWKTFGNAAGIYRNEFMMDAADPGDHLLAFPHLTKPSPGTHHAITYASANGLFVQAFPFA